MQATEGGGVPLPDPLLQAMATHAQTDMLNQCSQLPKRVTVTGFAVQECSRNPDGEARQGHGPVP